MLSFKISPLLICFLFFCSDVTLAQSLEPFLKNFTRKNGLPSNEVYCIFQDKQHYLWISTDKGVVRYNGTEMKRFLMDDNIIFKIKEDENGKVWFFSQSGRIMFYENGRINDLKYNNNLLSITKDFLITDALVNDNKIYINSNYFTNYKIDKNGKIETHNYNKILCTSCKLLFEIIDLNNKVFVSKKVDNYGVNKHLYIKFKGKEYKIPFSEITFSHYGVVKNFEDVYFFCNKTLVKLYPNGNFDVIKMPSTILSIKLEDNNIWVGMVKKGVVLLNSELKQILNYSILNNESISSIEIDNEGGIWFSTLEKGVFYLKKNGISLFNNVFITNQFVSRVFNVNDSLFLFATTNGIFKYQNNTCFNIFKTKIISSTDLVLYNKNIIFGGFIGINNPRNKHKDGIIIPINKYNFRYILFLNSSSEFIVENQDFFTYNQSVYLYNLDLSTTVKNGFTDNIFKFIKTYPFQRSAITRINDSIIWAGTVYGLIELNNNSKSFKPILQNENELNKGISALKTFDNGMVAAAIKFEGIAIIKNNKIIAQLNEKNGLNGNAIKYILVKKNKMWVATTNGLDLVVFDTKNYNNFTINNLISLADKDDLDINHLSFFNGNILIATSDGIYSIAEEMPNKNKFVKNTLPFYITSIKYNNIDTLNVKTISLPYVNNSVVINFNAISYTNAKNLRYYYRFTNIDTTWKIVNNPELMLENLSAGVYNLQLKASFKNDTITSAIEQLVIIIEKPWWQKNWLKILAIFFIIALFYIVYKYQLRKIERNANNKIALKTQLLELEYKALQSQMNPHFIFNCLTSIQQLIMQGDNETANKYLVKFSKLLRITLQLSSNTFNTIDMEVDYIKEYVALEQLRFPNKFSFNIQLSKTIDQYNTTIPSMMLQPIVENCVKHAFKNSTSNNNFIALLIEKQDDIIVCKITDNGVGRKLQNNNSYTTNNQHKSVGINIILQRLQTFNKDIGNQYQLKIVDLLNLDGTANGTEVTLFMPHQIIKND